MDKYYYVNEFNVSLLFVVQTQEWIRDMDTKVFKKKGWRLFTFY